MGHGEQERERIRMIFNCLSYSLLNISSFLTYFTDGLFTFLFLYGWCSGGLRSLGSGAGQRGWHYKFVRHFSALIRRW